MLADARYHYLNINKAYSSSEETEPEAMADKSQAEQTKSKNHQYIDNR